MTADRRVGTRFGPYRIDALLGRGGMGSVYAAFDTVKGRRVALKLLHTELAHSPEFAERFRRESRTAARISEPHVVPIHDWGEIGGVLYIDMRFVEGADLRALLRRSGRLTPERTVTIVAQIASALDAAHRAGLVHRDVKPDNILVTDDDFAYLTDFGIAQSVTDTRLTGTGSAVGSLAYMAPERFENLPGDAAGDVYSLACVLHECLTGSAPFPAPTTAGIVRAHLMDPPPRPGLTPGVPQAFDAVVATGMAKNPAFRPRSSGELARAAAAALRTSADPMPARPGPVPTARWTQPVPTRDTPIAHQVDPHPPAAAAGRSPATGSGSPATGPGGSATGPGRSPARSRRTAVLAAGVVVLLGAVGAGAYLLTRKNDESLSSATTSTTATGTPSSGSSTGPSTAALVGSVTGADVHGFVTGPARCRDDDLALAILRTTVAADRPTSVVAICDGADGLYYRGAWEQPGNAGLTMTNVTRTGDGYLALTDAGDRYEIRPSGLRVINPDGSLRSDEPAAEYAYRR